MSEYAIAYDNSGEPKLHSADCVKLQPPTKVIHGKGLVAPAWYFEADTLDAAITEAADAYAEDLDLFDGRYETVEEARELSVKCVHVMGCAKETQ